MITFVMDNPVPTNLRMVALSTPFGLINLFVTDKGISRVRWHGHAQMVSAECSSIQNEWIAQVSDYFSGRLQHFDLPIVYDSNEVTSFSILVYKTLAKTVPYGATISYGLLAAAVGKEHGARAVGRCMAVNPWPIIVPCHRVILSNGGFGGYQNGPLTKVSLLKLERTHVS